MKAGNSSSMCQVTSAVQLFENDRHQALLINVC
jgi:hypothetical protein